MIKNKPLEFTTQNLNFPTIRIVSVMLIDGSQISIPSIYLPEEHPLKYPTSISKCYSKTIR
jgi:hypothetical protein